MQGEPWRGKPGQCLLSHILHWPTSSSDWGSHKSSCSKAKSRRTTGKGRGTVSIFTNWQERSQGSQWWWFTLHITSSGPRFKSSQPRVRPRLRNSRNWTGVTSGRQATRPYWRRRWRNQTGTDYCAGSKPEGQSVYEKYHDGPGCYSFQIGNSQDRPTHQESVRSKWRTNHHHENCSNPSVFCLWWIRTRPRCNNGLQKGHALPRTWFTNANTCLGVFMHVHDRPMENEGY